jgi:hypothetical protein
VFASRIYYSDGLHGSEKGHPTLESSCIIAR